MGVLSFATNEQLQERQDEAQRLAVEARQSLSHILGLAAYVRSCWNAARDAKREVENRMLACERQKQGKYSTAKLAQIEEYGQAPVYMMLTQEKCFHCESWLEDILFPADAKPWGIKPTSVPDLSPEQDTNLKQSYVQACMQAAQEMVMAEVQNVVAQAGQPPSQEQIMQAVQQQAQALMQEKQADAEAYREKVLADTEKQARKAGEQIEKVMEDEMEESGWSEALRAAVPHIVGSLAGFVKGPVIKRKQVMQWNDAGEPAMAVSRVKEFSTPSPFDIYPAPESTKVGDGYLIELHRLMRKDLHELIGVPGYDDGAIRRVLEEYGAGGLKNWVWLTNQAERDRLEGRDHTNAGPDQKIEALQFWGSVQGRHLLDFGLAPAMVPDPMAEYSAEVWLIGSYVIKAQLNPNPLGKPPYFKASFREVSGAFWGMGLPEIISDVQDVCNGAARAAIANMSISASAQVGVDTGALAEGEDVTEMFPSKIWQFDMASNGGRTPIWFFQPQLVAHQLLAIYAQFSEEADTKSGIPKYSYGAGGGSGALSTVGGMSMMMNAAARGIKKVIRNIDRGIVVPSVTAMWRWLMLYDERPVLRSGDIRIIAQGSSALMARETLQVRRNEAMAMISANPTILQLMPEEGFMEIVKPFLRDLGYDTNNVFYSPEELRRRNDLKAQMAQMQQVIMELQEALQDALKKQQTAPKQTALPVPQQSAPGMNIPSGVGGHTPLPAVDAAGNIQGGADTRIAGRQ